MAVHNIVIIGASFAGLGTAHYLLNNTIPNLEKANGKSTTYKLTLVSPSTHFYYKLASPRLLASPDLIPLSKAFLPLKDGFKEYAPDRFELVIGEATAVDEEKKAVSVTDTYGSSKVTTVPYATLILATGATGTSSIWNLKGSHENSVNALKEMHAALPKAKTVLIGGGGPAGVETAGQFALDIQNHTG